MYSKKYRTWIEISKSAIAHNYRTFRKIISPKTKLLGIVKSNAYGHELVGFSRVLCALGVDYLGVDSITEANTLREKGVKLPILVLGYTLPGNYGLARRHNLSLTLSSFESLKALGRVKGKISVHLKVDTGMHRQGFSLSGLPPVLRQLKKHKNINVEGLYTHFAAAKRPDSANATKKQIELFSKARKLVGEAGFGVLAHASATAGTLNYPEAHFDMVRVGIGLYGLWPSPETKAEYANRLRLEPALSWKTIISEIKTIDKGEKIGYDYTETLARDSRLAILPVGYWHGYWRSLSSKSHVMVRGKKAKVVGRIAMDMVVADVTGITGVGVGDEAVLIGKGGSDIVSADTLAGLAGTTSYEMLTRLNPLIKKFYI